MLQFGGFPFLHYIEEWHWVPGGPIQQFADPRDSCLSPRLIAACHDLLRLSSRAIPQSGCSILWFHIPTCVSPLVFQAYQFRFLWPLRLPAGRSGLNLLTLIHGCTKEHTKHPGDLHSVYEVTGVKHFHCWTQTSLSNTVIQGNLEIRWAQKLCFFLLTVLARHLSQKVFCLKMVFFA